MAEEEGDVRSAGSAERPDIQEGTKDEDLAALVNELATLGLLARDSDNGCEGTEQPPEEAKSDESTRPVLDSFDLEGIAAYIKSGVAKNIVCMIGAGVSVSAGIPDFRSPKTGLYANLEKYNLPHPSAVFELDYFQENPEPFYLLAKELMPGKHDPTIAHYFIRLLHEKGLLRRCYTQNIDSLESAAGVPKDKVIAAHGNFDSASCIECSADVSIDHIRDSINKGTVARCSACDSLVKPDIVFFGEALPRRFFKCREIDMPVCDLLIIMGTSLVVYPFASLQNLVTDACPRLLVNREQVGDLDFGEDNIRDALHLGDCDDAVLHLAELLGWAEDLKAMKPPSSSVAAAPEASATEE